jgi:SAM-dependent methyltransferase
MDRMRNTAKDWDAHVADAELLARSPAFQALRDRIVELGHPRPEDRVLDVGAGTGLLTLAVAPRVAHVWAIDISPAMCDYLRVKAASAELTNVEAVVASATSLPLIDGSVDLVVSNYCLHHLTDREKRAALAEMLRVLTPGGRLVIADMMFSLSPADARGRRVVLDKLRRLLGRGLPGIWRVAKNALRMAAGRWERPSGADWWHRALCEAGFGDVEIQTLDHEGGIATGRRPASRAPGVRSFRLASAPDGPERPRVSAGAAQRPARTWTSAPR